jgi:hexosaminidase
MSRTYWSIAALIIGLAIAVSPASAQTNVNCNGQLPAGTYANVNVAKNTTCNLTFGVTVLGNVTVSAGGRFTMEEAVINGNLVSIKAAVIVLLDADTISTNVILIGTTEEIFVDGIVIGGNVEISGAKTALVPLDFTDNFITGNVLFLNNESDINLIDNNVIDGNLVCQANKPPPVDGPMNGGAPNTVTGQKIGQCAGL